MLSIKIVLRMIQFWPPYLAAGIRLDQHDLEKGVIVSSLKRTIANGNAFGTHFGGSLYAMCDPWFVFIALHKLGKDYIIWDQGANINFVKAVKEKVYAEFHISDQDIEKMRKATKDGEAYRPVFCTQVKTKEGTLVAKVEKTLYIRKKLDLHA